MREFSQVPYNPQSHCLRYEFVKKNSDFAVTISGFTPNRLTARRPLQPKNRLQSSGRLTGYPTTLRMTLFYPG